MRIALCVRALVAVLGLAAVVHSVTLSRYSNDSYYEIQRVKRSLRRKHQSLESSTLEYGFMETQFEQDRGEHRRKSRKSHFSERDDLANHTIDCCPTVSEMIEPLGGSSEAGLFVELYRDENYTQRFHEISCHKDYLNKPCLFINKKRHAQSRCEQRYTLQYALVKNTSSNLNKSLPMFPARGDGGANYILDYIQLRSGCNCVVDIGNNKKKRKKNARKPHAKT